MREHKHVERLQYSKIQILQNSFIGLFLYDPFFFKVSYLDNFYLFDKSLFAVTTFQEKSNDR